MLQRLRAPLAALLALWISGDLAAAGVSALWDVRRWLFPYLPLFLLCEWLRRRRRLLDDEVFLLGAAAAVLDQGAVAKTLQDGLFFLGVNWLGTLSAAFDGGLVAVLVLHALDARRPAENPPPDAGADALELSALGLAAASAVVAWFVDAVTGRSRFARMLGPAWLTADILFAGAAVTLALRAWSRSGEEEPAPRDRGLWALAAFSAWLPPAQLLARLGGEWLSPLGTLYLLAWTALFAAWTRALWRERGHMNPAPRRGARPLLMLAVWRFAASAALAVLFGSAADDPRVVPAYAFLVDLPVRLAFFSLFFGARFAV